jgi:hypothetical protein
MAIVNVGRRRGPISFYQGKGREYTPSTIGSWVAAESRDLPWNTIGKALAGSAGHGETTDHLMTAAEVLAATDLDIEVRKVPVKDTETGKVIPRLFTTAYDDPDAGRQYFGAVSDKYEVVQPRESLAFFDNVLGQWEGSHYSAAWNMREKSMMGVTIELPDEIVIDPKGANDRIGLHLLGINSFDGSTGLTGSLVPTRWFCMNQLPAALRNAKRSFTLRHTANIRGRTADAAAMIGVVKEYVTALDGLGNKLAHVAMTDAQLERFLGKLPVFALDGSETDLVRTRVEERRAQVLQAWHAPHNENITGSRWGALNVVAEYMEYGRTVKGSPRTGTDETRQRAIGTLVHPTISSTITAAADILIAR